MRVLLITNLFPPGFIGGYELGAFDVARALAAGGHAVSVLTSDYFIAPLDDGSGIEVERILECLAFSRARVAGHETSGRIWDSDFVNRRNIRLLRMALVRFAPDRILCFNIAGLGPVGLLAYLAACGYRPVLFLMDDVFHGYTVDRDRRARFDQLFARPDIARITHSICMSHRLMSEIEDTLAAPLGARVLPGWHGQSGLARAPGAPNHPRRFVFASRVAEHKGITILLDAAEQLLREGCGDFHIDIVGDGDVYQLLVQRSVRRLGGHLSHVGAMPKAELSRRFADYDALLFPTWEREPFGFVVAEAARAGCIPIMTASIGASEWFLPGRGCLKIERDAASLAQAMARLVALPDAELSVLKTQAIETARRYFDFDAIQQEIAGIMIASGGDAEQGAPDRLERAESAMSVLADLLRMETHG